MITSLKAFVAIAAMFVVVAPSSAHGDDRYHSHRTHGLYYHQNLYNWSHSGYRNYHNYHGHHGHRRRSDNDDAAWAIGGLVLGTIIANSANSSQQSVPQNSQPLPPPQRRKVVTCYDEVAYDQDNKPYVARQCYETMQ